MSNKIERDANNRIAFENELLDKFVSKITGKSESRVVGNNPNDIFFVGKLSPIDEEETHRFSSQSIIKQISVDFILPKSDIDKANLEISINGNLFYRVFPNLQEQRNTILEEIKSGKKTDIELDDFEKILKAYDDGVEEIKKIKTDVIPVFEKITLDKKIVLNLKLSDFYDSEIGFGFIDERHVINRKIQKYIDEEINNIQSLNNTYCIINKSVNISDLRSEDIWNKFIKNNSERKVGLNWDINIISDIKEINDKECLVSINLINNSLKSDNRDDESIRVNTLFNSGMEIKVNDARLISKKMDYFEDDYKYDSTQKAIGTNCSVEVLENMNIIKTINLPIFTQYRLKTKDNLSVKFDELINSPTNVLNEIYDKMTNEINLWNIKYNDKQDSLTEEGKKQFKQEIHNFKQEILRFKNGIDLISKYDIIREAFILTNKAFKEAPKSYGSWRLFQIVFIVSLIADIATIEKNLLTEEEMKKSYMDAVDLLYFPTGGGKTEAFLGVTIFNLFYDRLRGKNSGTTAIIKYPLRLLSVQQVQRVFDIIATAEEIRKKHKKTSTGEEFSLGYYVGDINTPNELTSEQIDNIQAMSQEAINDKFKILDVCPYCRGKDINVKIDLKTNRLIHFCENEKCNSGRVLPLYIVDMEIYRYLPSVIVSTIDKQAALGYQSNYKNILGEVLYKCPEHGYTSKMKCLQKGCNIDVTKYKVNIYDPAPSLLIQDELHLIRESLGAYDGHYEPFLSYYIKNLSKSKRDIKVIGATATISSYKQQIYHLYLKDAIRFPCQSPDINENFYSKIDKKDLHRKILGYAPFGKAVATSVMESMKYMKEILWDYYKNPSTIMNIKNISINTEEEALKLLQDYWIILEYNNVKLDGNRILLGIEGPVNLDLSKKNIDLFKAEKMTGDDTFQQVRKTLSKVENTEDIFNSSNLIVATSMISHGVDADRFNNMFFFGMPGNTAEYIQAYSRVGRKYPGLVVVIMRPTREKDQSYLRNFMKFHEYKDILVEPVPINRWASKAIERTLPGILSGILINYYDIELQNKVGNIYMMKSLKSAIEEGYLNKEEIKNHLINIYGCSEGSKNYKLGLRYKEYIEESVDKFFKYIIKENYDTRDSNVYITKGIEKLGFYSPMYSLRDTENPIKIELG